MRALSNVLTLEHSPAELDRVAMVLQLGPGLSVRGGVSTVERLILEHAGSGIAIRHVATMEEGSLWRNVGVFAKAIRTLHRALHSHPRLLVHIHFASRGSTLRKIVLAWMTVRAGRPLILHAHGAGFDEFYDGLPRIAQRLLRRVFARASCLLVLSTQWREFYTKRCGLPAPRVRILCNPTQMPERIVDRTGRSRVQFLFLGRIGWRKGAFDLLQAFEALPLDMQERARLVFAGDGDVATLRERAAGNRAITVHGWIDRAQRDALLAASDVFVLPSHQEGVPMAMLEAMAHALPVITTPVGGIPDVVADRSEALIVQQGDPTALANAMRTLIEDESLRLTMGKRARSRAQSFDVDQYGAELIRIYRSLLEG